MTLNNLGMVKRALGEYRQAEDLLNEGLSMRRSLDDKRGTAIALLNLAYLARDLGQAGEASQLLLQGQQISREIGNTELEVYCQACLGRALLLLDLQEAEMTLAAAHKRSESLENTEVFSLTSLYLADARRMRGRFEDALPLCIKSVQQLLKINEPQHFPECLETMALILVGLRRVSLAAQFFARSQTLRSELHTPVPPADEIGLRQGLESCKTLLGLSRFEHACHKGQLLPLEHLLALATTLEGGENISLN